MRRNIVTILCDQLRPDFLPAYGCPAVDTPNLDSLAENGVKFTNAITQSPVCAPARATIMTGRYVSDHGVWTNDQPFRQGIDFLPQRMTAAGYLCGAFGKLHHIPAKDTKGFTIAHLFEESRLREDEEYEQWMKERHPEASRVFRFGQTEFPYSKEEYYENWICDRAVDFIESASEKEAPFMAWVSFQGPHGPLDPPAGSEASVREELIPKPQAQEYEPDAEPVLYRKFSRYAQFSTESHMEYRKRYCRRIAVIDEQIGRLIRVLKEKGLYENTTFLFSSDHGDLCGDLGMRHKGPMPYPGQLDIPLIIANHPGLEKGGQSDMLAGNIDIGATLLDIAGDHAPFGQSRSLIGMLNGEVARRKVNYSEFCDSVKILDTKKYRFAYYPFSGESQLFDKQDISDPLQIKNLAKRPENAAILNQMYRELIEFLLISKGVRIEAQDATPKVQRGLRQKDPNWAETFQVRYPLDAEHVEQLRKYHLDADYNAQWTD